MKDEVFFGEGMARTKNEYPDLYKAIVSLNEAAYTGKVLDYKTQKLIAIAITADVGGTGEIIFFNSTGTWYYTGGLVAIASVGQNGLTAHTCGRLRLS